MFIGCMLILSMFYIVGEISFIKYKRSQLILDTPLKINFNKVPVASAYKVCHSVINTLSPVGKVDHREIADRDSYILHH